MALTYRDRTAPDALLVGDQVTPLTEEIRDVHLVEEIG